MIGGLWSMLSILEDGWESVNLYRTALACCHFSVYTGENTWRRMIDATDGWRDGECCARNNIDGAGADRACAWTGVSFGAGAVYDADGPGAVGAAGCAGDDGYQGEKLRLAVARGAGACGRREAGVCERERSPHAGAVSAGRFKGRADDPGQELGQARRGGEACGNAGRISQSGHGCARCGAAWRRRGCAAVVGGEAGGCGKAAGGL